MRRCRWQAPFVWSTLAHVSCLSRLFPRKVNDQFRLRCESDHTLRFDRELFRLVPLGRSDAYTVGLDIEGTEVRLDAEANQPTR